MVSERVGSCSLLADIGSDHAYLPAALILSGDVQRAIVTDLRDGPLKNSVKTAEIYGLTDRMSFMKGDGLAAIRGAEVPDVITICGMGGELIAGMLSAESAIARRSTLVLQPMNNMPVLLRFLGKNGFSVSMQGMVTDGRGHFYRCVRAEYDGEIYDVDPVDAMYPSELAERRDPVMLEYLRRELILEEKILRSLQEGGAADKDLIEEKKRIISVIRERMERYAD